MTAQPVGVLGAPGSSQYKTRTKQQPWKGSMQMTCPWAGMELFTVQKGDSSEGNNENMMDACIDGWTGAWMHKGWMDGKWIWWVDRWTDGVRVGNR